MDEPRVVWQCPKQHVPIIVKRIDIVADIGVFILEHGSG